VTEETTDLAELAEKILAAAVVGIGGAPRPGQQQMTDEVARTLSGGEPLLVQAGTGTGKSLGYLAPAVAVANRDREARIIVATATLGLQAQLATKDIPALMKAATRVTGRHIPWSILKGRSNYACLYRVREGMGVQGTLFETDTALEIGLGGFDITESETVKGAEKAVRPGGKRDTSAQPRAGAAAESALGAGLTSPSEETPSKLGAEVIALRAWAEEQADGGGLGDRDDAPPHSALAWGQVSVPSRECLGAADCPFGSVCLAERAHERARTSQIVVTNHALLAVDALNDHHILPERSGLVIDEAHELTSRVTSASSCELSPQLVERVAKRCHSWLADDTYDALIVAAAALQSALDTATPGRVTNPNAAVVAAFRQVRDAARAAVSGLGRKDETPERKQARAVATELFEIAETMAQLSEHDVVWVSERERFGRQACLAPVDVSGLVRTLILADTPSVLTSATLTVGGGFDSIARSLGLNRRYEKVVGAGPDVGEEPPPDDEGASAERHEEPLSGNGLSERSGRPQGEGGGRGQAIDATMSSNETGARKMSRGNGGPGGPFAEDANARPSGEDAHLWRGIDVGSPFDYRRQGILYIARDLPKPGRDKLTDEVLDETVALVDAAGGRTLGLFASQRSAEAAAAVCRERLTGRTILCQGDGHLPDLVKRFVEEPEVSLFGTLSLWQGVDVPGATCTLVLIDKIPFPRPDDPLTQARQQTVAGHGGNGFMAVSATQAGLLLAQGAGRLIRTSSDRGVVAVLDPRLVTARYGSFLRASLPDFWTTTDREVALAALKRLRGQP
jgi:ATP-dependent DNA helicase DinG